MPLIEGITNFSANATISELQQKNLTDPPNSTALSHQSANGLHPHHPNIQIRAVLLRFLFSRLPRSTLHDSFTPYNKITLRTRAIPSVFLISPQQQSQAG